ncbi:MAG TPA: SurA N-terminal domain-containing protein [Burkholderiales bacterium]|nr:SurA N-terminal domain-containing protein [Burkholderiales bacterium]
MFDFIHRHKRLLQIILAVLIVPPFALFGVDWYFRGGDSADQVARVAGTRISQQEYGQALQRRQNQMRQMLGGKVDPAMLDSPEMRRAVLNQLIDERVLYRSAIASGMTVPNAELQALIGNEPAFKDDSGKFSAQRYRTLLKAQGMSEGMFEAELRKDRIITRSRSAIGATAFVPQAVVDRLYRLAREKREVSQYVLEPAQFTAKAKVTPEEAKAYYEAHKEQFELPEKVKLDYVILSLAGVEKRISVTPKEVQEAYESRIGQLTRPEERRASHILIAAGASATPEQKAKAKAKAEALLAEAKKNPKGFAELAKKNSEDPGSAAEGGDLGFFSQGKMVKPFDDAVFGMKVGEITGPVESPFGFHIIKLEAIKRSEAPNFETVKASVEEELKKSRAARAFAQEADEFSNLVYDQPDSLQPVMDKFKLALQSSGWVTRRGAEPPLLENEKFLRAVFSDNVLNKKQNSEALEIAPNMLISARVVAHEPAKMRAFDEVQKQIVEGLTMQKAGELARTEGEALLARLRKGEDAGVRWSAAQTVSRERPEGLQPEAAQAVFRADAAKLPAFAGVQLPGGRFALYRIGKVIDVEAIDPEQRKALARQLDPVAGQEALAAQVTELRQKADIKVDEKKLEKPS